MAESIRALAEPLFQATPRQSSWGVKLLVLVSLLIGLLFGIFLTSVWTFPEPAIDLAWGSTHLARAGHFTNRFTQPAVPLQNVQPVRPLQSLSATPMRTVSSFEPARPSPWMQQARPRQSIHVRASTQSRQVHASGETE